MPDAQQVLLRDVLHLCCQQLYEQQPCHHQSDHLQKQSGSVASGGGIRNAVIYLSICSSAVQVCTALQCFTRKCSEPHGITASDRDLRRFLALWMVAQVSTHKPGSHPQWQTQQQVLAQIHQQLRAAEVLCVPSSSCSVCHLWERPNRCVVCAADDKSDKVHTCLHMLSTCTKVQ